MERAAQYFLLHIYYRENCPKTNLIFENFKTDPFLIQPTFQLKETGKNKK